MSATVRVYSETDKTGKSVPVVVLISPVTEFPALQPGEYYSLYETRYKTGLCGAGYVAHTKLAGVSVEPTASDGVYCIHITAKSVNALLYQYRRALRYLGIQVQPQKPQKSADS